MKIIAMLLPLPVFAWAKLVTYTYATVSDFTISGPVEHTLVMPPDFPPHTQTFTCSFTVGS